MKNLLAVILILSAPLIAQDTVLTLKESLEIGLSNSKDLKISQARMGYAAAKLSETNSYFLPQLKLAGSYTRLSDNIPAFAVTVPFSPMPIRISDQILDNYSLKVGLQQPLFTGFRLTALRRSAHLNLHAVESEYSKEKNEAAWTIYKTYWQFFKADETMKIISQSVRQMEGHLKDTQQFYDNGLVSKNDLLKLAVQYSNLKLMLLEADHQVQLARIAFNKALGVALDSPTRISAAEMSASPAHLELADLLPEALNARQELKALAHRVAGSGQAIRAAKANRLPSIYLSSSYYYGNPNPRFQPAKNEFNANWDVGVSVSWDIWNWGLTSAQTRQAREMKIELETKSDQLKEAIQMEVYSNYLSWRKTGEKVTVSEETLAQADENYRVTVAKYKQQLATSTDLIDAETARMQAETNLKTARADGQMAHANLEKSLGRALY